MALAVCMLSLAWNIAVAGDVYQPHRRSTCARVQCRIFVAKDWRAVSVRDATTHLCSMALLAGPAWNGSAWSYSCNAPPPPDVPKRVHQPVRHRGTVGVGRQLCNTGIHAEPATNGNPDATASPRR